MIEITPDTDSNTQVTVGDNVKLRWKLNAQADPADVTIKTINVKTVTNTFTGSELTRELVDVDGERWWRYYCIHELEHPVTRVEYRLRDTYNRARDIAFLSAKNKP